MTEVYVSLNDDRDIEAIHMPNYGRVRQWWRQRHPKCTFHPEQDSWMVRTEHGVFIGSIEKHDVMF
jgi:hypothetical protein